MGLVSVTLIQVKTHAYVMEAYQQVKAKLCLYLWYEWIENYPLSIKTQCHNTLNSDRPSSTSICAWIKVFKRCTMKRFSRFSPPWEKYSKQPTRCFPQQTPTNQPGRSILIQTVISPQSRWSPLTWSSRSPVAEEAMLKKCWAQVSLIQEPRSEHANPHTDCQTEAIETQKRRWHLRLHSLTVWRTSAFMGPEAAPRKGGETSVCPGGNSRWSRISDWRLERLRVTPEESQHKVAAFPSVWNTLCVIKHSTNSRYFQFMQLCRWISLSQL